MYSVINKPYPLLVVLVVCLFYSGFSYGQSDRINVHKKVLYAMTFQKDRLDTKSKTTELTELLLSDTVSLFRTFHKASQDSAYADYVKNKVIRLSPPVIISIGEVNNLNYQILKNNAGQIKVYDEYSGGSLNNIEVLNYYMEPAGIMDNWTLSSDTMTINQFLCQKAEIDFGGRHWTAWFAPEIPISDGPYKFSKLPGLILKLEDSSKTWLFEFQSMHNMTGEAIELNNKKNLDVKKIEKERLFKDRRYYQKNSIAIRESGGVNFGNNKKDIQTSLDEFIKKDNNWIEL